MSYDDKVAVLVTKLGDDLFNEFEAQGLEFAQLVAGRHGLKSDHEINRWIDLMANKYHGNADTFGIRRTLVDIGPCEGTINSALREAVWLVALAYEGSELELLASNKLNPELVGVESRMVSA